MSLSAGPIAQLANLTHDMVEVRGPQTCPGADAVEQKPSNRETKANIAGYLWVLALSCGLAIGAAIGSIGAGIGIGVGVGVAVGLALRRRFSSNSSDD